eukprot:CAMPEP_0203973946 /NCGR_PEP_ID=MMETSP0359-20131031/99850_1 /ASSEMBLY_ACC=CAM_ASM_000338 /TAXON_ID=268821 /ORGANISM="Scrippsiella Hangoei, Strain SHTV-5" /LENGTH=99 /DNA_ID=CAMNT_0050912115 /DNA_START=190 /DNA_END=489 /DNA_ORIENTATION=-
MHPCSPTAMQSVGPAAAQRVPSPAGSERSSADSSGSVFKASEAEADDVLLLRSPCWSRTTPGVFRAWHLPPAASQPPALSLLLVSPKALDANNQAHARM